MNRFANPTRLLLAVCLLLGILLAGVARPSRAQAASGAEGAQPVRKELPGQNKSQPGAAYGLYLAVVKSRTDPHMRVQVEIPALNITEWAQACVPVGSKATPPLNSGVWVMFEQGDTRRPVWMGVPGN
jgi:hypothetical protein